LYDWLGAQIAARQVRGILLWRRLCCDLWHAELDTMRRWSPVPVLDIDAAEGDEQIAARTRGRLEAFLEMLS
jgi:benzoyl-CoA reductase/2-hydroxyglutaryl-CoA dehydratase subunit BcrC/BadD/HgdB